MTRDEAVAQIQQRMGFHTGLASEIQTALQQAQQQLEHGEELPWFLKSEYATINTVADEERVVVPTDFLRELEDDEWLYHYDAAALLPEDEHIPLEKVPPLEGRWRYPGSGAPKLYSLDKDYIRIFPTPDDIYTLKMQYYKQDAVLSSNIENEWLKHRPFILIGLAGMHVTSGSRDQAAYDKFSNLYAAEYMTMINVEIARQEAGATRQRGGAD